jgi:hypothetical protein
MTVKLTPKDKLLALKVIMNLNAKREGWKQKDGQMDG